MASEIRCSGNLTVNRDGFQIVGNSSTIIDMTGSNYVGKPQVIGTTYETVNIGQCGNIRYVYIKNVSTGSVSVSMHADSQSFAVMQEDDFIVLPPSASFVTYKAKSTLAGSTVQVVACEK